MTNEQFENFVNRVKIIPRKLTNREILDAIDEEWFPNGESEDYQEDMMEKIYHEMGE